MKEKYSVMELCDSHVHIGYFREFYFSPEKIAHSLKNLGVKKWSVSSTSTCAPDFNFNMIVNEIEEMIESAPGCTHPLLWVTPQMLKISPDLKKYESQPKCGYKIHGMAHDWPPYGKQLKRMFSIAKERKLPIMLHTGGRPASEAGAYERICKKYRDVIVVLAHGRPVEQAIRIMKDIENIFVDTAFMPYPDIASLVSAGMSKRILLGSDFPMDKYFYPSQSVSSRYRRRLTTLDNRFGIETINSWSRNFNNIYNN